MLFVSYVTVKPAPPTFGNQCLDCFEPETEIDVHKLQLKLQHKLTEMNDGKLVVPIILAFKKLRG